MNPIIYFFLPFFVLLTQGGGAKELTPGELDRMDSAKDAVLERKLQLSLVKQLIRTEDLETQYPKVEFQFVNEMSSRYLLQSLEFFVDSAKVYSFFSDQKQGQTAKQQNHELHLPPGKHQVRVVAIYQGNDTGVFSYLSDYKVRAESELEMQVEKGIGRKVKIRGFEKGGLLTDFKERPGLEIAVDNL